MWNNNLFVYACYHMEWIALYWESYRYDSQWTYDENGLLETVKRLSLTSKFTRSCSIMTLNVCWFFRISCLYFHEIVHICTEFHCNHFEVLWKTFSLYNYGVCQESCDLFYEILLPSDLKINRFWYLKGKYLHRFVYLLY